MGLNVRRVDYFYATINEEPAEACELLTQLANLGINLVALNAIPLGPQTTQLTLFPADTASLAEAAKKAGLHLTGPHGAILVQGDDKMGALASIHSKLRAAGVGVFSSSGVTDGKGSYGYIIYVNPGDSEKASRALQA